MNLFTRITKQTQKTIIFSEDYKTAAEVLAVYDVLLLRKKNQVNEGWPYQPSMTLPVTINGKYKGDYYLVSRRNAEPIDIFDQLADDKKGDKLGAYVYRLAIEEHDRVIGKEHNSQMSKATIPLSIAAAAYTVILAFSILMQGPTPGV